MYLTFHTIFLGYGGDCTEQDFHVAQFLVCMYGCFILPDMRQVDCIHGFIRQTEQRGSITGRGAVQMSSLERLRLETVWNEVTMPGLSS